MTEIESVSSTFPKDLYNSHLVHTFNKHMITKCNRKNFQHQLPTGSTASPQQQHFGTAGGECFGSAPKHGKNFTVIPQLELMLTK